MRPVGALRRWSGTGAAGVSRAASGAAPSAAYDAVRLGRGGEVDRHLRQRQLALRARRACGTRPAPRRRSSSACGIRQADVLRRHARSPGGRDQRVLPALDHPRHPVERALRIAAPQRLVVARRAGCSAPRPPCRTAASRRAKRLRDDLERDPRRRGPTCCAAASSTVSARRASPSACAASKASASSSTREFQRAEPALPVGERPARAAPRCPPAGAARARTPAQRDSSAAFSSKLGFSVVAPISVIVPCSTAGGRRPAGPC